MDKKYTSINITKEQHKKIRVYCVENDLQVNDFLVSATNKYMEEN